MNQEKNFTEKFDEIQTKLQSVIGRIIGDIAKTDDGVERLRVMHENHAKLTKYDLNSITDPRDTSD